MHPAFLLLPAAICAAACVFYAAEAAHEARTWRCRLHPTRGDLIQFVALAATAFTGASLAMVPVITWAVDTAIARGLAR